MKLYLKIQAVRQSHFDERLIKNQLIVKCNTIEI